MDIGNKRNGGWLGALFMCMAVVAFYPSMSLALENLARGASYTLDPAPNYQHCTDPDDRTQLTDGAYSQGYFWVQPSTVGWNSARPVIITLDLGAVKPIGGVSFNTAAGVAGVEWPTAIFVLSADEDKQFHDVGELIALSAKRDKPPAEGYAMHRFWADALKTHGRYVAFVVWTPAFAFVDEIEVYAGEPAWVQTPLPGEAISDIKAYVVSLSAYEAVARRLRNDLAALREQASVAKVDIVDKELASIEDAIKDIPRRVEPDFRAVLPLNPLHARLFRAQAQVWQAIACAPVTVWQSGLWDSLAPMANPPPDARPVVNVAMMGNEYRAAALNVSNASQEVLTMTLNLNGLPGGVNPAYVTVHAVAWTDTNAGEPVAAALPVVEKKDGVFGLEVLPGLTRQVWFTFHPVDVEAGTYSGAVQLKAGAFAAEVPLTLKVYPFSLPDKPRLHFGGWDYTDVPAMNGVTAENRTALITHLREHFVDSPWGTSAVLPVGQHDSAGAMTAPPDTAHFDQWLGRWPGAAQYLVFANMGKTLGTLPMGTPEFDTGVKAWAAFWADHAREKGLKPEQLSVLLVDESSSLEQDAIILAWAKAIRAADTGLRVWEDPVYQDMTKANQDMVAACHVLCPNRQIFSSRNQDYRDYFAAQRNKGTELAFYSCSGPVRLLDPYAYHRLQAWSCWRYGAKATFFWAMGDNSGASCWNEYAIKGAGYTPLFLDATTVTPGKHMEACREGVEDYEYLAMLSDAIDEASKKGIAGDLLDRAKKALDELPKQVCESGATSSWRWRDEKVDRTAADTARVAILDQLAALRDAMK